MSRAKRPCVITELLCYDLTNILVCRGVQGHVRGHAGGMWGYADVSRGMQACARDIEKSTPGISKGITCNNKIKRKCPYEGYGLLSASEAGMLSKLQIWFQKPRTY